MHCQPERPSVFDTRHLLGGLVIVVVFSVESRAVTSYLDNGTIRIGADLDRGGAINYLSESGSSQNIVNVHDLGRFIQQSYYSGPQPFIPPGTTQNPGWAGWGWNPVQAGDSYGFRSVVIDSSNDGTTLYTKSRPKQWALRDVDTEATMESWITLDGRAAHVRSRLTNVRSDMTQYGPRHQELPAVYTIGTLNNLYTYTGLEPFTNDALTQISNNGPPWEYWDSNENWAAYVNDSNWGVGVFHPGAYRSVGGFHGTPGFGGPTHNNTGYISPLQTEILDGNIVFEHEYTLLLGDLHDDIRSYVYNHQPDVRPRHVIRNSRQHLTYLNASDDGLGHGEFLRVDLSRLDPQVIGPQSLWDAADVSELYVTAAISSSQSTAQVFFADESKAFAAERQATFSITPDGKVRTYVVKLASNPLYDGPITRFRFDPVGGTDPDATMDLYSISFQPEPSNGLGGDFDANGIVDGNDFLRWQVGVNDFPEGGAAASDGDADRDGDVDGDDFLTWQSQFGNPVGKGAQAVPEPCGCLLLALLVVILPRRFGPALASSGPGA